MKYILMYIGLFLAALIVSWLMTCGIVKLITWCFGVAFSWPIATGIWLITCLISMAVK